MEQRIADRLPDFMDTMGLTEPPMGFFFTNAPPAGALSPAPMPTPTRQREEKGEIDWGAVFGNFTCAIGLIWRARRKGAAAAFSAEQYGCPGAAFWMGFLKPQSETIIHYVSSGIPGQMEGEFYCESPDALRRTFLEIDPPPAGGPWLVVKHLDRFEADETPELVAFFARPEAMCGLHQLAFYVTNDTEVIASPWSAACGSLVIWPLKYHREGRLRAALGGWDISARKFFKPDELSLSMPYKLYERMIERADESFLSRKNWENVKKKIALSEKTWSR